MAKKPEETTAVAVAGNGGAVMPFEMDAADIGAGVSDISTRDVALPFIAVLQSNSPQLKKGGEKFILGAAMGDFFNTATNQHYNGEDGIRAVPCLYKRAVVEWHHRDNNGGWVATHPAEYLEDMQRQGKTYTDEDGRTRLKAGDKPNSKVDTLLVETGYFFLLVLNEDGTASGVLLALSSTQWKAARTWNSLILSAKVPTAEGPKQAPIFSQVYRLTTGLQKDKKGNEWYGINVRHEGIVPSKDVYETAKRFRKFAETASVTPVQTIEDNVPACSAGKAEGGEAFNDEITF